MSDAATYFFGALAVGAGATLFMDIWALLLKYTFRVPRADYCLVGRWLCHMPEGMFRHASIVAAVPKRFECAVGWIAHYVLGIIYVLVLVAFASKSWLVRPTIWPAILLAVGSLLVPFLIMQPAFGIGIAASKTPNPTQARLRSVMAHVAFGVGLYVCAVGVSYVLRD
jgi:hypothetical protein